MDTSDKEKVMPLMEWDESMSVSIPEIDDQHKQLINLINQNYDAIRMHDEHTMVDLIGQMREYAEKHFAYEEGYIRKHGYPDMDEHKKQHEQFSQDVLEFQKQLFGNINLSQIFIYLSRWLTSHILEEDMKYVPYMPTEAETEING